MRKVFENSGSLKCIFTDDGITFYGSRQEVYFPYGCIDSIKMSLMGVLQAVSHIQICSFAVDRKDRAEMKEMVAFARQAMKTAPKAESQIIDLTRQKEENRVSSDLPAEEQLKQYKAQFIQGILTKEEYDLKKRLLKG